VTSSKDWEHSLHPAGTCRGCEKPFAEEETYHATLVETEGGFERRDYCAACWTEDRGREAVGFWLARRPKAEEKKRLFVNDEVLMQIFRSLAGSDDESKRSFTFVLALILIRKRLLKYVGSIVENGQEWWRIRPAGEESELRLMNPNLTEAELDRVREGLNDVLAQN